MSGWTLWRDGVQVEPLDPDRVLDPAEQVAYRLRTDAGDELLVPPLDELNIYGSLPTIPDATLAIHYEVTATPIGTVRVELHLEDGRMVSATSVAEFDQTDLAVVAVSIDWARHVEWRSGSGSVLEALEGAPIDARWQVMLLAHGLLQQPEWRAALRGRPQVRP